MYSFGALYTLAWLLFSNSNFLILISGRNLILKRNFYWDENNSEVFIGGYRFLRSAISSSSREIRGRRKQHLNYVHRFFTAKTTRKILSDLFHIACRAPPLQLFFSPHILLRRELWICRRKAACLFVHPLLHRRARRSYHRVFHIPTISKGLSWLPAFLNCILESSTFKRRDRTRPYL